MDIDEALSYYVAEAATIKSAVSGRVYAVKAPVEVTLDCITYQRISDLPSYALDGELDLWQARIQFTVISTTYDGMRDLALKLIAVLSGFKGIITKQAKTLEIGSCFLGMMNDEFELQTQTHLCRQDYLVTYKVR